MRHFNTLRSSVRTLCAAAAVLATGLAATAQPAAADAKFEPQGDRVYGGVSVPDTWDEGGLRRQLDEYEGYAGKRAAVVTWFASTYEMGKQTSWRRNYLPTLRRVQRAGAVSLIKFSVQDYAYNQTRKMAGLKEITNGEHDAYFGEFATTIRDFGQPVFISINHEMNGTWYPYSAGYPGSNTTPEDFVASWRHIVDIFRKQGADNAAFVWSPNVPDVGSQPFTSYYPGDNYVDWVGASFYSGNKIAELNTLYRTYAPSKPIFITEWATGTDKNRYNSSFQGEARWVNDFFAALESRYPRVKGITWFQWDKSRDGESDYRIQRVPAQQQAYAANMQKARYADSFSDSPTVQTVALAKVAPPAPVAAPAVAAPAVTAPSVSTVSEEKPVSARRVRLRLTILESQQVAVQR